MRLLYIDKKCGNVCTIADSDGGEPFDVYRSKHGWKLADGTAFQGMDKILGYLDKWGSLSVVSKYLVQLLSVIECISYTVSYNDDESIPVCDKIIDICSRNFILVALIDGVYDGGYSVLDMLMCASYDKRFVTMLEKGTVVLRFGFWVPEYLAISLCGDYKALLMKLIVMYRNSNEFLEKVSDGKLI